MAGKSHRGCSRKTFAWILENCTGLTGVLVGSEVTLTSFLIIIIGFGIGMGREREREKFEGLGVWIGIGIGIWFRYKSLWTGFG